MRTFKTKTKAWFSSDHRGPEDLDKGDEHAISSMSFHPRDMTMVGWSLLGEAEITVRVGDTKTLVENKVASIRAQMKKDAADAQLRQTMYEQKIQNLLALTFEP